MARNHCGMNILAGSVGKIRFGASKGLAVGRRVALQGRVVSAKLGALAPAYFFFGRYFFSIDATTT
jgi:hypothetical protein